MGSASSTTCSRSTKLWKTMTFDTRIFTPPLTPPRQGEGDPGGACRCVGVRGDLMFESLSDRLSGILDKLTRRGSLTDSDVTEAMREVRRALLEADVALEVVRDFTDKVKAKAVGQNVVKSVTPGQMVVKIVHDELVAMLGSDAQPIDLVAQPPVAILLVGPAGLGQDHDVRQDRLSPHQPRQEESADGLARRAPAGGAGAAARAGRADQRRHAGHRRRADAAADHAPRHGCRPARRLRRGAARHGRPHPHRRGPDAGDGGCARPRPSARDAAGGRQPDRPGRGEAGQELQRARRHHRHRADPRRRRRPRRRRALHARGDGQADQADRRRARSGTRWRTSTPSASPAASSAWATW